MISATITHNPLLRTQRNQKKNPGYFVAFLQIQTSELASMWAIFHPQIKMDRFRTQFHTLLVTKRASCYQAFGAAADRIQDNE